MIRAKQRVADVIHDPEYQYADNYLYCGGVFLREKDILSWVVVESHIAGREYRHISVVPPKREVRKFLEAVKDLAAGEIGEALGLRDSLVDAYLYSIDYYNLR